MCMMDAPDPPKIPDPAPPAAPASAPPDVKVGKDTASDRMNRARKGKKAFRVDSASSSIGGTGGGTGLNIPT